MESLNFHLHEAVIRYKILLTDSQRRLTRDLGLLPYLAILRCHLPLVWCQRRPVAHQQYHHCPLVRPPTLFPMVWVESHGKQKGGTLTSLLLDKEISMKVGLVGSQNLYPWPAETQTIHPFHGHWRPSEEPGFLSSPSSNEVAHFTLFPGSTVSERVRKTEVITKTQSLVT